MILTKEINLTVKNKFDQKEYYIEVFPKHKKDVDTRFALYPINGRGDVFMLDIQQLFDMYELDTDVLKEALKVLEVYLERLYE